MTRQQLLDLYFIETRSKLIDIAAFLDRIERAEGEEDFRVEAFRRALSEIAQRPAGHERARRVLMTFSDPTSEPIPTAPGKGACGAWEGARKDA